ncbi:MAG: ferrous iron transport protein A [Candidatus Aureabacteria bacterium]|nr:ferrous iron transport protein A [Candidatus Auribacterota bacterium]
MAGLMNTPDYKLCPLCGFEFEKDDTACAHGCPFNEVCHLIRCPSCHYEFHDQPQTLSWFQKFFKKNKETCPPIKGNYQSILQMKDGEEGTVAVICAHGSRKNSLAVFSLVPGSKIRMLQHTPAVLIQIGETQLALDTEIAKNIFISPASS